MNEIINDLKELKLSDDLFPKYEKNNDLVIKKLELIDNFNSIRNSSNELFKDGFINIARAKYSSNKSFGKDYWDETVQATVRVEIVNGEVRIKEEGEPDEKVEEETIRNRKKKEKASIKEVKVAKYNPINMFGVLVPYQLKQSQEDFSSIIPKLIELVNLIKEIESTNNELK